MKFKIKNIIPAALMALTLTGTTSCIGDLDVNNINPQQVSTLDKEALFNKIYANMVLTGQVGPDGNSDIAGADEGAAGMLRQLWNANELCTDEAICAWGDAGLPEYNYNRWGDSHPMTSMLYYRLMFGVTLTNFFLDQTSDEDDATATQRAEVRFMRALYYYYMMDIFGNPPMVTDMNTPQPPQATRSEVFGFIEGELLSVLGENNAEGGKLPDAPVAQGRASKAAANLLLARLYLNAEVYTGKARWEEARTYAQRVIDDSGWGLLTQGTGNYTAFQKLFMGDNSTNGAQKEIILPAMCDGDKTQSWGMLFLVAAMTNADITADYPSGTSEAWGGNHCRLQFSKQFMKSGEDALGNAENYTPDKVAKLAGDDRALFYTKDRTANMDDPTAFTSGYAYVKFTNVHSDGSASGDGGGKFIDTDFPVLRVAEAYLTYAEADARLNGGSCTTKGLEKLNALRERAHAKLFTSADLDEILSEWSREFGFEARRRMDLIRFNKFGGQSSYVWQYESGEEAGAPFDAHYNIYALPATDLNANPNLKQNPGF